MKSNNLIGRETAAASPPQLPTTKSEIISLFWNQTILLGARRRQHHRHNYRQGKVKSFHFFWNRAILLVTNTMSANQRHVREYEESNTTTATLSTTTTSTTTCPRQPRPRRPRRPRPRRPRPRRILTIHHSTHYILHTTLGPEYFLRT